MRIKKTDIALPEIRKFFMSSEKAFRESDLKKIFKSGIWDLPTKMYFDDFIVLMKDLKILREVSLNFNKTTIKLYVTLGASSYNVAYALSENVYFSHYTAASLHQLTEQIPKTVYVSKELTAKLQDTKEERSILTQEVIDLAMQKEPRMTSQVAIYKKSEIIFLNAKNAKGAEIISLDFEGFNYRVTSLERTLIDAVIRPYYCGGISEVLNFFKNAHGNININKIIKILIDLDYIYPYHQALGLYLSLTGVYSSTAVDRLKRFGLNRDFYLCHGLSKDELQYSEEWKMFYPSWFV
jgi:hypothetical protein